MAAAVNRIAIPVTNFPETIMDECRALVVKRSFDYEDIDAFRKCRSLHQKIGFVLDKWQESIGDLFPRVSRQELLCAEQCLDETEKKLWKIVAKQMAAGAGEPVQCAAAVSRAPDQRQQPLNTQLVQTQVLASQHSPSANNQVVRVQRRVQVQNVAVQHVGGAQPKMLPVNKQQQVVNLLVDWYITLGENGIHLEGMLLNEGHWKTSPIADRVGPLTVKTASGTTYNMSGEMYIPQGENIPDFIYDKFRFGFPDNWKQVVQDWLAMVRNENRLAIKQNSEGMPKAITQHSVTGRTMDNKAHERVSSNDQEKMPPPNRTPRLQRKAQSQENLAPRAHSVMERGRHADMTGMKRERPSEFSPQKRRSSNRVLMKSLNDISMNSTAMSSPDMSVEVNSLKRWSAQYIEDTGELVLLGHLVSESQQVIDRNFISSSVVRRLQADLIETADGEFFRLIGPANSKDQKLYNHGFPLQWKHYVKRGAFPLMTVTSNIKASRKQDASSDRAVNPSQNIAKSVKSPQNSNARSSVVAKNSPLSSSIQQQKRTSQMIQHIVRHNIKQRQNSTIGSQNNGSMMSKKDDTSVNKRKNRSLLPLQHTGTLKKMRTEDIKSHGGALRSQQNGSEADVSSQSGADEKHRRTKNYTAGKDKKAEGERADMQSSRQGKASNVKKSTLGSQLNTTGKYLSGMASDIGSGEFDFNIF